MTTKGPAPPQPERDPPTHCPTCGWHHDPQDVAGEVEPPTIEIHLAGYDPGVMAVYTLECSSCGGCGITIPEGDLEQAGQVVGQRIQQAQQGGRR